jgi:general secretion pathway protein F/type IV pilus assembly protein PilC
MPDFAYTARDASGNRTSGVIAASSQRDAVAALTGRSLFPLEVAADQPARQFGLRRRVSAQVMVTTYGQLAALLRSGVPLLRSLDVIRNQTSRRTLAEVLEDVHDRVKDGASLADAMSHHRSVFGEMAVNMVRAGGEGGFLEDALDRVALFAERQEDLKSRTMGALAYPMFLMILCLLVVAGLLVFFVPRFEEIFERLRERGELPWATEALLGTSAVLHSWGWLILLLLAAAGFSARRYLRTEAGRLWWDHTKLRLPLGGAIFQSLAVARFCRVLGTLLHNGVPILKSLEISRPAAGNLVLSNAIAEAAANISAGETLAEPLARSSEFPADVVEMIAVAEESATLDKVLVDIADGLDRRTARKLDLTVRLLEPLMLLVLASIVLMIALALLLPILKMSSSI